MRIAFMGTPEFAVASLEKLCSFTDDTGKQPYKPVVVVTVPDKPSGRGLKLTPSAVKVYAESQGITVLQPESLKDESFHAQLRTYELDLAVVVAFRILPQAVYTIPKLGSFNLHGSLLPDYRGAAPINWVLINGERETGVTTFMLEPTVDTGNILVQERFDLPETWNASDLHDFMKVIGADVVLRTVQGLEAGTLQPKPQQNREGLHPAPKLHPENTRIDWSKSAKDIYNLVRGICPYPTAWTEYNGVKIKILVTKPFEYPELVHAGNPTGAFMLDDKTKKLIISTGEETYLEIITLKPEGKKEMSGRDFWNGLPNKQDTRFE
jgi:methionyl-tRNA formyltransferase